MTTPADDLRTRALALLDGPISSQEERRVLEELVAELDRVTAERDKKRVTLDRVVVERNQLVAELDRVTAERDQALERWADECDKLDGHLVTQGAEIDRLRDLAAALEAENARLEAEADLWAKR